MAVRHAYPRALLPVLRGFMTMDGVPCLADEVAPPDGELFDVDAYNDGRLVIVAHPATWAMRAALHLAERHRPEGIP